jgi:hypothetical protein
MLCLIQGLICMHFNSLVSVLVLGRSQREEDFFWEE